jgi:hypothetical protein
MQGMIYQNKYSGTLVVYQRTYTRRGLTWIEYRRFNNKIENQDNWIYCKPDYVFNECYELYGEEKNING